MLRLSYETSFDAAHRLPDYQGKCANLHGHTWKVRIEVEGAADPKTGMLVDFTLLKKAVHDFGDHQYLNDKVANPTAENLVGVLLSKVRELLIGKPCSVLSVTVWESEHSSVTAYPDA